MTQRSKYQEVDTFAMVGIPIMVSNDAIFEKIVLHNFSVIPKTD